MGIRKLRKRPCSVCRRWFLPDSRVKRCQKTCGPACRSKWEARRQARWRERNPDYEAHRRLQSQLAGRDGGAAVSIRPPPEILARVPWILVQTAMGAKEAVVIGFLLRLLDRRLQTAIRERIVDLTAFAGRLRDQSRQTAMEGAAVPVDDPP